jgi:hypothetical protein
MLCARDKVKASLGGMSIAQRLAVTGRILCADLPRPVNDR